MERESLGAVIARLRKEKGMTQLELAERMGVTDKAVSKWERDLSYPDTASFPRLASELGVSVDELMGNITENRKDSDSVRQIADTALKAVALAMGIATAILSFMGNLPERDGLSMLGIGLTCIAIHGLVFKREK